MRKFKSQFHLGEMVRFAPTKEAPGDAGQILAVTFTESKVTYDLALALGGEVMVNIDSCFCHPYH